MKNFCLMLMMILGFGSNLIAQHTKFEFTNGSSKDLYSNISGTFYGNTTQIDTLTIGYNAIDYFSIPPQILDGKFEFNLQFNVKFTSFNLDGDYPTNNLFAGDNIFQAGIFSFSYQKDQKKWVFLNNSDLMYFDDPTIIEGKWYLVKLSRDKSGKIRLFVNGKENVKSFNSFSNINISSFIFGQETDSFQGGFVENQSANAKFDNIEFNRYDTLSITGRIHQNQDFFKNGSVIAYNITDKSINTTFTNNIGEFKFDSISAGEYIIKAVPLASDSYLNTFYPNIIDSVKSVKLNLVEKITELDLYMISKSDTINFDNNSVIKISPIPFENQLNIELLNTANDKYNVDIHDIYGGFILKYESDSNSISSISTSELKSGFYILKLSIGNNINSYKILKN